MRTNPLGLDLVDKFSSEYDTAESRTSAENHIRKLVKPHLTSNQFSSLVPLVMHLGECEFKKSRILQHLNSNRLLNAADAFRLYIYLEDDRGRFIDENLILYREMERSLFLMPEIIASKNKRTPPSFKSRGR